ncbi:MAG: hypothetical protein NXI24_23620 [bacterium]|nr:hypothetical protein [bacterium]
MIIMNSAPGRKMNKREFRAIVPGLVAALLLTLGYCAPTRDAQTITQLESARDQVHSLYDTFTGSKIDEDRVDAVRSTLAAMRSYEESKGRTNVLMVKQIEAIEALFEKHLAERKAVSRWSGTHKNNKKELIGVAFQTAIATENEKNE